LAAWQRMDTVSCEREKMNNIENQRLASGRATKRRAISPPEREYRCNQLRNQIIDLAIIWFSRG
jgi:hypothetical protein